MEFNNPWPAPSQVWNDPPWILSGRCLTAWFETDFNIVKSIISPSFTPRVGASGVITRVRFYDVDFRPEKDPTFGKSITGSFREAVIAFRGKIGTNTGEYSAFMWTDDFTYASWGREIFGWPLQMNKIYLTGEFWGDKSKPTAARINGDDFSISLKLEPSKRKRIEIGKGQTWLTPRRTLFLGDKEISRNNLLLVRPKVIKLGTLEAASGSLSMRADGDSILSGLQPIGEVSFNLHKNFEILVGNDVKII